MSNKIEIVEREEVPVLEIKAEAAIWKMPSVIGSCYKSIMDLLKSKQSDAAKEAYVHYLDINWDELNNENKIKMFFKMFAYKWNMKIGFTLREKVEGEKSISADVLKKGKYVKTLHKGPYQKVSDTYKEMLAFLKERNLNYKNESIEFYLNDPRTVKKEDLETIVLIPLK